MRRGVLVCEPPSFMDVELARNFTKTPKIDILHILFFLIIYLFLFLWGFFRVAQHELKILEYL